MKKRSEPLNLLAITPKRLVEWESNPDGTVALLVPKFENTLLRRWLMPRLKRPHIRMSLDEIGTFFWLHCDGSNTVEQIAERMRERFGDKVDPALDRLKTFLQQLERERCISVFAHDARSGVST